MARRLYALLLVLFILIPTTSIVVKAAGTGYLAIKDYLGRTWTMQDVEKIINYCFETASGENKSLADYFWIVVDDDPDNKYNLRNFTASPLDGKTAVLALPAGDHYVDIYWFGYHQHQLVHIIENQHYVLNLETAPVVPFKTAGEPPSSAEWDLAYSPDGLKIQRKDGNAYVLFKYNTSYIEVGWLDKDLGGWNYQNLDIYIDGNYKWQFHIRDPAVTWYNKTYTQEITLLWKTFNYPQTYVSEHINWSRNGTILRVTYQLFISHYKLDKAINELNKDLFLAAWVTLKELDPLAPYTGYLTRINDYRQWLQQSMDNKVTVSTLGYTDTIIIVWDVFVTPTQIMVLAHAYDIDSNGNVVKKPITSANAFTIDNRLVFIRQLHGGYYYFGYWGSEYHVDLYEIDAKLPSDSYINITNYNTLRIEGEVGYYTNNTGKLQFPGGEYFRFYLDDISKYRFMYWLGFSDKYTLNGLDGATVTARYIFKLRISFDNANKADAFEEKLNLNGFTYTRTGNVFDITVSDNQYSVGQSYTERGFFIEYNDIYNHIPPNSSGYIELVLEGYIYAEFSGSVQYQYDYVSYYVSNIRICFQVIPKLEPPQISLLKDGYQTVTGAFAVQVYTQLVKEDEDLYMLGYYLLGNNPPPCFIVRDVSYDVDRDIVYLVWTIITADAYGQDIVDMTSNTTLNDNNETIHNYYLCIKSTIRYIENVTLVLFNYNKMAFLKLSPQMIKYLLAIPPGYMGYGTPVIDLSTLTVLTINTTRPYKLYYKAEKTFIEVNTVFYNDTLIYDIVRANDSIVIEKLSPGDKSRYFYKLVYTDNNETHYGWLYNDKGTLKIITGVVIKWTLPEDLVNKIIMLTAPDIYNQWQQFWDNIAEQLGLITEQLNNIAGTITGAWDWLNRNKWLLLGGFLLFIILIIMLASAVGRPRIYVGVGRR